MACDIAGLITKRIPTINVKTPRARNQPQLLSTFLFNKENAISETPEIMKDMLNKIASAA